MKSIKVTDVGTLKNELNKYRKGKKFDISQFNQVARLAWLGKIVLQPLDPADPDCKAFLLYADYPDPLIEQILSTDKEGSGADILGHMHIVDAEQGVVLAKIMEQGFQERVALYQDLKQRDFYLDHFYKPKDEQEREG